MAPRRPAGARRVGLPRTSPRQAEAAATRTRSPRRHLRRSRRQAPVDPAGPRMPSTCCTLRPKRSMVGGTSSRDAATGPRPRQVKRAPARAKNAPLWNVREMARRMRRGIFREIIEPGSRAPLGLEPWRASRMQRINHFGHFFSEMSRWGAPWRFTPEVSLGCAAKPHGHTPIEGASSLPGSSIAWFSRPVESYRQRAP